jgi:hypothetical protein
MQYIHTYDSSVPFWSLFPIELYAVGDILSNIALIRIIQNVDTGRNPNVPQN